MCVCVKHLEEKNIPCFILSTTNTIKNKGNEFRSITIVLLLVCWKIFFSAKCFVLLLFRFVCFLFSLLIKLICLFACFITKNKCWEFFSINSISKINLYRYRLIEWEREWRVGVFFHLKKIQRMLDPFHFIFKR